MSEQICTCPEGHDQHTREGEMLAYYCPTHGDYLREVDERESPR